MPVSGTVYARNLQNGVTVMSSDPRSTQFVQWEANGDPSGGDIQAVSEELANTPAFLKALRQGILSLQMAEDNALDEMLNKQTEAWNSRQDANNQDIRATIENTVNNDMVTLPCVGPSTRGSQKCGEDVLVRELAKYDAPPLCHRHIGLASEYVPTAVDKDVKGNQIVEWTRSMMDERVRLPR